MKRMKTVCVVLMVVGWMGTIGSTWAIPQAPQQQNPPAEKEAAKPQQAEQKQEGAAVPVEKVTLYVYRQRRSVGSGLKPSVYADDSELARMENGRFFIVKLDPGKHSIRSNDKASGIDLDMKPGQDYYVRIDIEPGVWKGHGRLTLVLPEQGGYEVKQTKLLDDSDIKDHELVAPGAKRNPEQ